MSHPGHIIAPDLHEPETLDEDIAVFYEKCEAKLGLVPNVLPSVWPPRARGRYERRCDEGHGDASTILHLIVAEVLAP